MAIKKGKTRIRQDEGNKTKEYLIEGSKKTSSFQLSSLLTVKNLIVIIFLLILLVAWKFKSYFIVATVNNQPISRFELNDNLFRRFGQQSLENLINERLILAAVREKGILITSEEINSRIKEMEARLEGQMSLEKALELQGLTETMLKRQLEIQLSIEKIFSSEATVSSKEIEDYLKSNNSLAKNATDPALLREQVKSILVQQKINQLFTTWFEDIKKNAVVRKFI